MRIKWTEEEKKKIIEGAMGTIIKNPGISITSAIKSIQGMLPPDRRKRFISRVTVRKGKRTLLERIKECESS